jgi:hypothetical protein
MPRGCECIDDYLRLVRLKIVRPLKFVFFIFSWREFAGNYLLRGRFASRVEYSIHARVNQEVNIECSDNLLYCREIRINLGFFGTFPRVMTFENIITSKKGSE